MSSKQTKDRFLNKTGIRSEEGEVSSSDSERESRRRKRSRSRSDRKKSKDSKHHHRSKKSRSRDRHSKKHQKDQYRSKHRSSHSKRRDGEGKHESSTKKNLKRHSDAQSDKKEENKKTNDSQNQQEEIDDDDGDMELLDEEEQLKKEVELRNKRWAEIKMKHEQQLKQEEENSKLGGNIVHEESSLQVVINTEQNSGSNFETQINENQIQENTNGNQKESSQNIDEQPKHIEEVKDDTTKVNQGQKNDEFYKMLDKQRENWYQQEITHQEALNDDIKEEEEKPKQQIKGYDMFLESDEEDAQISAIQKGFQVTVGQVDVEGYYQPKAGEMINNRYMVKSIAGKGVFSCVVKAIDQNATIPKYQEVAIKIIRMFDIMRESGEKEKEIVNKLNKADSMDKRNIIRLLDTFEYNNHLCLVYECMERNLRETLNKFGRNVGLSLDGVCSYGRQLFLALSLLHKLKLIHADLKPDNIMVSKDTQKIKLCDFGSCVSVDECGIIEYMASRFYRAPEIMLGCKFDQAIDVWSAGVTLFELYTGKVMFTGRSNNQMLKMIMQSKGKIKAKLLKQGEFVDKHFDPANQNFFLAQEEDPTNKGSYYIKRILMPAQAQQSILAQLKSSHSEEKDQKSLALLAEFIERCLVIDPSKRITSEEALQHPFLNILKDRALQQKK